MNLMDKSEQGRKRGTLIGLAVGDALGAAVEFMSPGSFEKRKNQTGYCLTHLHELL